MSDVESKNVSARAVESKQLDETVSHIESPIPFDQELKEPLISILKKLPKPLTPGLISLSREQTIIASLSDEEIRCNGDFSFLEIDIPGPKNSPNISLIICVPTATPGPYPIIYNIHGGGMVAGNNRTAELAGELMRAKELQLAIVAVNYRLAPENPDPAPIEDCYAGLIWLSENAYTYKLNPKQIIISGNSAGGGLAAGVTLLARDRGYPNIIGQMLQCPMLDDRCETFSANQLKDVGVWDTYSNITAWNALLGVRRGSDNVSCYAAPARAKDLSELPPAFIDVGAVEALRDDAINYANRIWQCGGEAELHIWSGAFHSFDQWVPDAIVSKAANQTRISWIQRILNR
ncbi:MAG: alpha/beta hydrolase [Pseudomonadota bacterium]